MGGGERPARSRGPTPGVRAAGSPPDPPGVLGELARRTPRPRGPERPPRFGGCVSVPGA